MTGLSVDDVANVSEVPPRTVRRHLKTGRLKGKKTGRDWTIEEADAAEWIRSYQPYDTLRGERK